MSKLLVIKAHPLTPSESRSLKVLDAFIRAYKLTHPDDDIAVLDVYHDFVPEIDKDMLLGWEHAKNGTDLSADELTKITRFSELTDQFLESDKIVIANPLWNLNIPTRLKAWIDAITVSGKTFKYTEHGPAGLVTDKKLVHIQANGGNYGGKDPSSLYIEHIFSFMGITDIQSIFVEGIDHNPSKAEEIMDAALTESITIATTF
ncbi:MAG: FMN-dependent NADH-azoreductase [Vagococcus sp.]